MEKRQEKIEFVVPAKKPLIMIITISICLLVFIGYFLIFTVFARNDQGNLIITEPRMDAVIIACVVGFGLLIVIPILIDWFVWKRHPRQYRLDNNGVQCSWLDTNKKLYVRWDELESVNKVGNSSFAKVLNKKISNTPITQSIELINTKRKGLHYSSVVMNINVPLEMVENVYEFVRRFLPEYKNNSY